MDFQTVFLLYDYYCRPTDYYDNDWEDEDDYHLYCGYKLLSEIFENELSK